LLDAVIVKLSAPREMNIAPVRIFLVRRANAQPVVGDDHAHFISIAVDLLARRAHNKMNLSALLSDFFL
jgi:hypothetical protein